MNLRVVLRSLGIVLICEALFMLPSLFVAIIYKGNDILAFSITLFIMILF